MGVVLESTMDTLNLYKSKKHSHFKMMRCLQDLNHTLAIVNNLSWSISSARPLNYVIRFLHANLDCGNSHLICIGSGDDGRVLKVVKDQQILYAMKVYEKDRGSDIRNKISKDQAYREFKALKLISEHPNFLSLYSDELDECMVQETGGKLPPYEAWALRFNYVETSMPVDRFWFYLGMVYHKDQPCINYTTKSILITHITHQMLSALAHLRGLHIRHRDLDMCNILIQITSNTLRVYFIDFARADLPDAFGMQYTESPNLKLDHGISVRAADALALERAYMVPKVINKCQYISAEKEPSDFRVLCTILKECVMLDDHRLLLNTTDKSIEKIYEEELFKLYIFFDMLFLSEGDDSIQNAIQLTAPSSDPAYVQDEIKACFDFFTGEASDAKTQAGIIKKYRGTCAAFSNNTKKNHNVVDTYWESCQRNSDDIKLIWQNIKRKLKIEFVDRKETYKSVHDKCEEMMENLPNMSDLSRYERDEIMGECFEVYRALTKDLYSSGVRDALMDQLY